MNLKNKVANVPRDDGGSCCLDRGSDQVSQVSSVPAGATAVDPAKPSPVISGVMSLAEALRSRSEGTTVQPHSPPSEVEKAAADSAVKMKVFTHVSKT